jgi:2-phosphosulfolactate phosphatase
MPAQPASHPARRGPLNSVEVLMTPADFEALSQRDLRDTVCVVFDILRATTTIVTALDHGATCVIPVAEIADALGIRARQPQVLLAGERHGLRIHAEQAGGRDFDFGNSPREFTADKVSGRMLVTTTTNGTRALRACLGARLTLVGSFLNLDAVASHLVSIAPENLLVVCSGTFDQAAYEDMLAAGALLERLDGRLEYAHVADTVPMARHLWQHAAADPESAVRFARNARKLLGLPNLAGDVAYSLRLNTTRILAWLTPEGEIRRLEAS